jgi:MULE transposase domain
LDTIGERTGARVVKDIFFINKEQIELGRRFVSGFIYKTDATFNTNELRILLSSIIGITNIGKTFPLAYCYITSESAKAFEFIVEQLTKYIFYDCLEPEVIIADFCKGLGAAIIAKAKKDIALPGELNANGDLITSLGSDGSGLIDISEVVINRQGIVL